MNIFLLKPSHTTAIVSISENRPSTFSFSNSNEQSMICEFNQHEPPKYKDIIILNEKQINTTTNILNKNSINNNFSTGMALPLTFQEDNNLPKYEDLRVFA